MPISLIKEEEEHILKLLPILLKRDRQFKGSLYAILMETFATKDDFTRILEEIKISREETNRRFEEINKRFEAIDRRFEEINKRFEAIDRRFEEINKRFEAIDRRFEAVDRRFEAVDRRFEELIKEMHRGFRDLTIKIDTLGARWGIFAEETLRNTLQELLLKDLKPKEVKELRINDKEGYVFGYPSEVQIDLLIKNKEHWLVEISSSAGSSDVTILSRKANLYELKTKNKPKPIFVCINMTDEGKDACKQLGIQLITYDKIKDVE